MARGALQTADGRVVTWTTSYTRLPSSGHSNPAEKRYGADGIFEIELTDEDGVVTRKSLLFQAKKEAHTFGDARLRKQARQIASVPGGGLVIDYRPDGYVGVDAGQVARGDALAIAERSLEDVLAEDFVECRKGSSAYYYDPQFETLHIFTVGGRIAVRQLPLGHRIRTQCTLYPLRP